MPTRADRKSPRPGEKSVTVTTRIPTEIYDRAFDEAQKRGTTVGREVERLIRAADDLTAIFSRDNLEKVQLYNRIFINALQLAEDTGDQSGFDVAFFDIVRRLLNERKNRTEAVMTELERKMVGVFALVGSSPDYVDQMERDAMRRAERDLMRLAAQPPDLEVGDMDKLQRLLGDEFGALLERWRKVAKAVMAPANQPSQDEAIIPQEELRRRLGHDDAFEATQKQWRVIYRMIEEAEAKAPPPERGAMRRAAARLPRLEVGQMNEVNRILGDDEFGAMMERWRKIEEADDDPHTRAAAPRRAVYSSRFGVTK